MLRIALYACVLIVVPVLGGWAQPVPSLPNFQVTAAIAVVTTQGGSMAADRFGNVFILDQALSSTGPTTVTRVQSDGTIAPAYFASSTGMGQLAYNPVDGFVYGVTSIAAAPIYAASVYQLSIPGGIFVASLGMSVSGFTIDNQGRYWMTGQPAGPGQPAGLYLFNPAGPPGNLASISSDSGQLQALVSGDVLVLGTSQVRRLPFGTSASVPYYQPPSNTTILVGLGRGAFNQLGPGGFVATRTQPSTVGNSTSTVSYSDALGTSTVQFCYQTYGSVLGGRLQAIASGPGQDLWWLGFTSLTTSSRLFRFFPAPAAGVPGSLLTTTAPGAVTLDLYAPMGLGSPFLLGLALTPLPPDIALFAPGFGSIDLNPFHAAYGPLIDGIGLFGAPSPLGAVPTNGHFQLLVPIPGGLTGIGLELQALMLGTAAPNGVFFVSNRNPLVLP